MEKSGLDFLINQGCEVIVIHASRLSEKELLRHAAHFPTTVAVSRYIAGMANCYVWLENNQAAKTAALHLPKQGHRCIACVTGDLPITGRRERPESYHQALAEYGIMPDRNWVIGVPFNGEGGERAAHQLLNCGIPFIAATTFNDVMTAGVMCILH